MELPPPACLTGCPDSLTISFVKAFVTGGTGFVGSHLVDRLLEREGVEVFALVRDPKNLKWLEGRDVHLVEGDLFSLPELPRDLDFVFHIAGLTKAHQVADYYTVNQEGTASLFQSLRAQRLRPRAVVHLSTVAAAGPSGPDGPRDERRPPRPVSHYGRSKLYGEYEALRFSRDFPVVILRAGVVYGARDKGFLDYFKFVKRGIAPSFGLRRSPFSLCFIHDLVKALISAGQAGLSSGELINVSDPAPATWDDIGSAAARILGRRTVLIRIPLPLTFLAASVSELARLFSRKASLISLDKYKEVRQTAWVTDVSKAARLLDFAPSVSLEEGLERTLRWYLEKGWL